MPQLEEPTTKNKQLCTGGLWGEKGNNKILKKKKKSRKQQRRSLFCQFMGNKTHWQNLFRLRSGVLDGSTEQELHPTELTPFLKPQFSDGKIGTR